MMLSDSRENVVKKLLILTLGFFIFSPALICLINKISLVAIANESLSYRYFYSLRLLQGEQGSIILLPQGQILMVVQHGINLLLSHLLHLPITDTWKRVEIFGYVTTLLCPLIGFSSLCWVAFSKKIIWPHKILITILLLSYAFASKSGLSAFATPDYSSFEAVLTILSICLFIHMSYVEKLDYVQIILLGCFAAILVSMKVSLIFTACFPLLGLIYGRAKIQIVLLAKWSFYYVTSFLVTIGFIFYAFYCFNFKNLCFALPGWWAFLANPGSEPNFWHNFISALWGGADKSTGYGYAWFILTISMIISCFIFYKSYKLMKFKQRIVALILILTSFISLYFLYHRPAGTTLWEVCMYLSAVTTLCLILNPKMEKTCWVFCGVLFILSIQSVLTNFNMVINITRFKESSQAIREIHQFAMQQPKIVAFIPNNDHTTGTLEEGMMKGMSDFPTWNISKGYQLLADISPGLRFAQDFSYIDEHQAIFWIGIPHKKIPANLLKAINQRYCRTWLVETWKWRSREVIICEANSRG